MSVNCNVQPRLHTILLLLILVVLELCSQSVADGGDDRWWPALPSYNRKWHLKRRLRERSRRLQELEDELPPEETVVMPAPKTTKCKLGCHVNGVCYEELGRCDCPRHFVGPTCSEVRHNIAEVCETYGFTLSQCRKRAPCFNSCNRRGQCVAGICHCYPGHFGMDCSLSMGPDGKMVLLEGQGYVQRKDAVKIYVYELPPNVTSWFYYARIDRPLHLLFWQRIMSLGVRTADGDEADYFFIPLNTRFLYYHDHAKWVLPYIKKTWPYWNRDNGHRHIIIHTGDMGPLEQLKEMRQATANVTWLTYWGLFQEHKLAKWKPAFRPGKDIVLPVLLSSGQGMQLSPLNPVTGVKANRTKTFFFAGRICGDRKPPRNGTCPAVRVDYSAGTRQRVYEHHYLRPGYKVAHSSRAYLKDISTHKFCLAPTGGGHGKRNILVTLMGCVPVTVTDGVHQPFEPELSWAPWSVPLAEADIPRMHEILEAITDEQYAVMQSKLRCMAQHMYYSSTLGAVLGEDGRYDAIATLLEILRMRRDHPDLPPESYMEADKHFRDFVNCELAPPPFKAPKLCVQGHRPSDKPRPRRPRKPRNDTSTANTTTTAAGAAAAANGTAAAAASDAIAEAEAELEAAMAQPYASMNGGLAGVDLPRSRIQRRADDAEDAEGRALLARPRLRRARPPPPPSAPPPPPLTPRQQLLNSLVLCTECVAKIQAQHTGGGWFGWPGGAICCDELNLAHCPRWDEDVTS